MEHVGFNVRESSLPKGVRKKMRDRKLLVCNGKERDRLCGLVVRISGYRYRGHGFDSRRYQIF